MHIECDIGAEMTTGMMIRKEKMMGKEDKKTMTILVIKDKQSKALKAYPVREKGSGDGELVVRRCDRVVRSVSCAAPDDMFGKEWR